MEIITLDKIKKHKYINKTGIFFENDSYEYYLLINNNPYSNSIVRILYPIPNTHPNYKLLMENKYYIVGKGIIRCRKFDQLTDDLHLLIHRTSKPYKKIMSEIHLYEESLKPPSQLS